MESTEIIKASKMFNLDLSIDECYSSIPDLVKQIIEKTNDPYERGNIELFHSKRIMLMHIIECLSSING